MSEWHYPQINGETCVLNPRPIYEAALELGYATEFWGLANSITMPIGLNPGSAWFIVNRVFHDAIDRNGYHTITWNSSQGLLTLNEYVFHRSVCLTQDGDSQAPYLVEFRDKRQVLSQSSTPYDVEYNIPQGHYTGSSRDYWPATTKAGILWTWQQIFEDLWGHLPGTLAGAAPQLVWTPSHRPESWRFHNTPVWTAIGQILDALQSTLVLNQDGTFRVLALGDLQAGLDQELDKLVGRLLFDVKSPEDCNRSNVPEKIRVCFHRAKAQEHCPPRPVQHEETPVYEKDVNTNLAGAQTGSVMAVWSDLLAEVDHENNLLNQGDCDNSASEIAARASNRLDVAGEMFQRQYGGMVKTPWVGEQIHLMRWRDFGDDTGFITEYEAVPAWAIPSNAVVQVPRKHPTSLVVRTLEAIPPRDGAIVYSGLCDVYEPVGAITPRILSAVATHDGIQRVRVFNLSCELIPEDCIVPTWLLEDGTRYVWKEQRDQQLMVRALNCIKPGETGNYVQPQMWNSSTRCWEDDPGDAVLLDDCCGWVLALPDDVFPVYQMSTDWCECGPSIYRPVAPYGLTRRVKIKQSHPCSYCGDVTVLKGGIDFDCYGTNESSCIIQACNMTGRNLVCDVDYEFATMHIAPGRCGTMPSCVAWLVADKRPTRAKAELMSDMCENDEEIGVEKIKYKDVCSGPMWQEPFSLTAHNIHKLLGCAGDSVELGWNDATCSWEIVNVQPHIFNKMVTDVNYTCGSNDCQLQQIVTKAKVALQQCYDCGETIVDTILNGKLIDVPTDLDITCAPNCAAEMPTHRWCLFGCDIGAGDPIPLSMVSVDVPDGMDATCTSGGSGSGDSTCSAQLTTHRICILGCDQGTGNNINLPVTAVEVTDDTWFRQDGLSLKLDNCRITICVFCADVSDPWCDTDTVEGGDCAASS